MASREDTSGQVPWNKGPLPATKQWSLDLNQGQVAPEYGLGLQSWVPTAPGATHKLCDLGQVS